MRAVSRCLDWSGLDMMTATWCVSSPCGQKFGPSCYDYHAHYTKHSKELPLAASKHCSPLLALPTHVRLEGIHSPSPHSPSPACCPVRHNHHSLLCLLTHMGLEILIHPLRKVLPQHVVQCDTAITLCSPSLLTWALRYSFTRSAKSFPSMLSSAMSTSADSRPISLSRTQPPAQRSVAPSSAWRGGR